MPERSRTKLEPNMQGNFEMGTVTRSARKVTSAWNSDILFVRFFLSIDPRPIKCRAVTGIATESRPNEIIMFLEGLEEAVRVTSDATKRCLKLYPLVRAS